MQQEINQSDTIVMKCNTGFCNLKIKTAILVLFLCGFIIRINAQENSSNEAPPDHITISIERINKEHKMREVVSGDTLYGRVEFRISSEFSYAIFKDDGSEIIKGNLQAEDGAFDNDTEWFKIIAPDMPSGNYRIYLYTCNFRGIQGTDNYRRSQEFVVQ